MPKRLLIVWTLFAAVMGFAFGGSFVWAIDHPNSQPAYSQPNQGTEATANPQHKPSEPFWQRATEDPTAFFTLCVAAFTFVLAVSTIALWIETRIAGKRHVAEMQRIGEAQVRAYVDIAAASVVFMSLAQGVAPPTDEQPFVKITAKNTGQSPARNFVWNPTISCFSVGSKTKNIDAEMGANWREIRGIGISAGAEHSDGAILPILINKFLRDSAGDANVVLVQLRVQFEYEDVFSLRIADETYFSGWAIRKPGEVIRTDVGNTEWTGRLSRIHKPRDWLARKQQYETQDQNGRTSP